MPKHAREMTPAAARLLAIHAKVGPAAEPELSEALGEASTAGASSVVVKTVVVMEVSNSVVGAPARTEYALTRTA